jgi:hypothetical protein
MTGDNDHTPDTSARASAPPDDTPQEQQTETGGQIVSRETRCPQPSRPGRPKGSRTAQLAALRSGSDPRSDILPTLDDPFRGLRPRERRFVRAFLESSNAAQAAQEAGYAPRGDGSWGRVGWSVQNKLKIQKCLKCLTELEGMECSKIVKRVRAIALADFGLLADCYSRDESGVSRFDLARARRDGVSYLVKSYTSGPKGDRVEIHDQQRAQELLARLRGWLTDRVAVQHSLDLASMSDEQLALLASGKPPAAFEVTPARVLPGPGQ